MKKFLILPLLLLVCAFASPGQHRSLASLDKPLCIMGVDYHVLDMDPQKVCNSVIDAGGNVIGVELGGLMNSGPQGKITDVRGHYTKQIAKLKKLVAAAKSSGLWVKVVFWNSNALVGKTIAASEINAMFDLMKKECGTANLLVVVVSEFGHEYQIMPKRTRDSVVAHGTAAFPHNQLVCMDSENTGALFHETHLSILETRLSHRDHFIVVTDNNATIGDSQTVEETTRFATAARKVNLSAHYYSKESAIPTEKWKAMGAVYHGVN